MKFSTRARYGTRAMAELAAHHGERSLSVHEIAQRQALSPKYLEQLLAALRSAGLVRAVRGAHGGYVLAMPPGRIAVYDVVTALDGPVAPVDCVDDPGLCPQVSRCPTREVWKRVGEAVGDVLKSETLADLAGRIRSGRAAPTYSI